MGKGVNTLHERLAVQHCRRQEDIPQDKLKRILSNIDEIFQSGAMDGYEKTPNELIGYFEATDDLQDACGECRELVSYLESPHGTPQSTTDAITQIMNGKPAYSPDDIDALRRDIIDLVQRQFPSVV